MSEEKSPIFKDVFGARWDNLPPVFHKHYAHRAYSQDKVILKGYLDVMCKPPLTWLAPFMRLLGQIPPRNEKHVETQVILESQIKGKALIFNREFAFRGRPYRFKSRMVARGRNRVAEIMRFGLCWKMFYVWNVEEHKVQLLHDGYAFHVFGLFIPLPLTLLLGKGYAEERAVSETVFDMETNITHAWWGKIYEYKGQFEIEEMSLDEGDNSHDKD